MTGDVPMYELFGHTADLGLRVRAPDLDTLFAEAGRGLFAMVVENLEQVQPVVGEPGAMPWLRDERGVWKQRARVIEEA